MSSKIKGSARKEFQQRAYDVPLRPSSRKLKKTYGKVNSKTWKRWVSTGMEPAGSPVTVRDGDFSSPDAQRGTGG